MRGQEEKRFGGLYRLYTHIPYAPRRPCPSCVCDVRGPTQAIRTRPRLVLPTCPFHLNRAGKVWRLFPAKLVPGKTKAHGVMANEGGGKGNQRVFEPQTQLLIKRG